MSIKKRIYFVLILLSLLPLALISLLTAYIGEEALKQIIARHNMLVTLEKADAITRILDDRINETRLLAQHPAVIAAVQASNRQYSERDREEVMSHILRHDKAWITNKGITDKAREIFGNTLSSTLKKIQQRRPDEYGEMFVTNRLGATLAMTKTLSDFYQADEYWWQAGSKIGERGAFFDDRGYDETVKSIVVGVTVPVRDGSETIGVFKINYKVKSILEIVTKKTAKTEQIIGLVRSTGGLIVSSNPAMENGLIGHEEEITSTSAGGWWEDSHGDSGYLGAHAPVGHRFSARIASGALKGIRGEKFQTLSWHVISEQDKRVAFEPLEIIRTVSIGLAVVALLLAALLGILLSRSITDPLTKLKRGAQTIGNGNLNHRIDIQQRDEFGAVANSFDRMATRLQKTLASRDELNKEITERIHAQNALSRFKFTLDQTLDCIFMFDPQTLKFFYVNRGAMEQVNYSFEELLQMTPLDIKPEFDEYQFRSISEALIQGPEHATTFETIHRRKNGTELPVEVFLQYISTPDQAPRFVAIVRDITERRHAEEESGDLRNYLQNVFNAMPSILAGVDSTGNVVHWNLHAEEDTGITATQAMGRPIGELLPMIPDTVKTIGYAITSGQAVKIEKFAYIRRGESHFAEAAIYPLTTVGSEGAMIRIDDVTDRTRMEDMMVQTEKMLSVGGLAAGMAHEINNPLGGMMQGLQNIRRRLSPELNKNVQIATELGIDINSLQHYLEKREIFSFMDGISRSGKRAGDIVNNMLHFSRKAESGFESVDPVALIDRTIELAAMDYDMKRKYDFRSIIIERDYQSGLPKLYCIAGEIQQVLLNLVRNAAQAMHELPDIYKEHRISLSAWLEKNMVCIQVADNGPGMDEEIRRRVFEPFFTTKPPGKGTGLGLSVSYYIVHDEHAGEISVESAPGKGSRFTLKIPVATGEFQ
ncbi:MAG: PAS domain S-box protein [Candidatus Sedimenticola sp. (ex Thyasira tokunagai)]